MAISLAISQMDSEDAGIEPFERVRKGHEHLRVNLEACQGKLAVLGISDRSFLPELEEFAVN